MKIREVPSQERFADLMELHVLPQSVLNPIQINTPAAKASNTRLVIVFLVILK
jgi:hypothetical protein